MFQNINNFLYDSPPVAQTCKRAAFWRSWFFSFMVLSALCVRPCFRVLNSIDTI